MADISTDQIIAFFDQLKPDQISQLLENIRQKSDLAAQAMATMATKMSNVKQFIDKSNEAAKNFISTIETGGLAGALNWTGEFAKTHKEILNLGTQALLLSKTLKYELSPQGFIELGKAAEGATSSIAESVAEAGKMSKVFLGESLGGGLENIIKKIEPFAQLADQAKNFENGLLATTAASGELGVLLENIGEDMSGLNLSAERFSSMMQDVSAASHFSLAAKDAAAYAKTLMAIPQAMDMTVDSTTKGIADMHLLDASIKVASGTGQSFNQIFEQMNKVYRDFGSTGQTTLEYITRLSSASQDLKLPLDLIKDYSISAAESFKFLGDNTQATLTILGRFAPALKDLGMGPRAITDLVGNIAKSISQLSIAQKSFLSGQTGGPRGLQGGYQIELLLQQGKLDQVQAKVESSLRQQFGGRIVTLEEAAKDSRAAGQFTKQVQFLTQGPTKIAGSESEAYKILDVMAKGGGAKGAAIKSPEESFKNALKTGDALQERQTNILTNIQNLSQRQAELSAISAYNLTRLASGDEGLIAKYLVGTNLNKTAIDSQANLSSGEGSKLISGEGIEQGKEVKDVIANFYDKLFDSNAKASVNLRQQVMSQPINSTRQVTDTLSRQDKINELSTKKMPGMMEGKEQLDITIHALCEKCMGVIAEEKATKVGRNMLQQHESNKNIAVQLGHDPGL